MRRRAAWSGRSRGGVGVVSAKAAKRSTKRGRGPFIQRAHVVDQAESRFTAKARAPRDASQPRRQSRLERSRQHDGLIETVAAQAPRRGPPLAPVEVAVARVDAMRLFDAGHSLGQRRRARRRKEVYFSPPRRKTGHESVGHHRVATQDGATTNAFTGFARARRSGCAASSRRRRVPLRVRLAPSAHLVEVERLQLAGHRPRTPLPITRPSSVRMGSTSAAVPVKNASSAM